MTLRQDWAAVFWGVMLPISWGLSGLLGLIAQHRATGIDTAGDIRFQSVLFLSIFLALFGMVGMRVLIGRAIDFDHRRTAFALGTVLLSVSIVLIYYGLSSMTHG